MAKIFVSEIKSNQEIQSSFVVADKQLRPTRTGSTFVTLRLVDKTGEVVGRIWENAEELEPSIPVGEAVAVTGRSETYKGELQLNIQQIRPLDRSQVDATDFLPVCPLDPFVLFQQLKRMIATIKDSWLKRLMQAILEDRGLMDRFRRAPAAKSIHHAYLGGLLEHTVSVATLSALIAKHYPSLNRDLLIAGAILHDLGKIDEFTYDLSIDYSNSGRLLGHMILGLEILDEKVRAIAGFPPEQAMILKHLILSHHGEYEFGAAKLPMTREAFVLHLADDMDAKVNNLTRIMETSGSSDGQWTAFQPIFDRFFFRGTPSVLEGDSPVEEDQDAGGVQLSLWHTDMSKKSAPSN